MRKYLFWTIEWKRNGMVGITDGINHVVFTEAEWNEIRLQEEFNKEATGGYPDE
jgi:hypothetical protein